MFASPHPSPLPEGEGALFSRSNLWRAKGWTLNLIIVKIPISCIIKIRQKNLNKIIK